ncbi:MAG: LytTR family DNA-binding domain-containing protein, partial [Bacteroidota bacterium]
LKCIVIDDEPLAVEVLESYIARIDHLELAGTFNNAIKAFEFLQQNAVDLIFLDIQMPRLTGLEFAKTLTHPPKIIFTTAYREFALEGFELEAIDYLLKPIAFDRFLKAIGKLVPEAPSTPEPVVKFSDDDPFIYFKVDKKMVKIRLGDILYIESLKDYVKVVTSEKEIITHQQISYMEHKLPENQFIRVHRSFIVAIDKVEAFSATDIEMGKHHIPIGRNYKNEVTSTLGTNVL